MSTEDLKTRKYIVSLLVKNVAGSSQAEFKRQREMEKIIGEAGLIKKQLKLKMTSEDFIKKYIVKKLDKKIKKAEDSDSSSSSESEPEPPPKPKKKRIIGDGIREMEIVDYLNQF